MLSKGFLEQARALVAADTVSSQGTRRAADLLQPAWEHAGLQVRRQVVDEVHVNILGGPGGETSGRGGVLLVTHLDTVPPGPPFPEAIHLRNVCGVVWCYVGTGQRGWTCYQPRAGPSRICRLPIRG